MRHRSYIKMISKDLQGSGSLKVLDIGCALCDFTARAWDVNHDNRFWGLDISSNAIAWVRQQFPEFTFEVGAIPDIPFEESFDLVFCLEVLCYLSADDRRKAIDSIHSVLEPSGKIFFSGVLDGGHRHHTEQEVIELIQRRLTIREVDYNHWAFYRKHIEFPLEALRSKLVELSRVLALPPEKFESWAADRSSGKRLQFVRAMRLLSPVPRWLALGVAHSLRWVVSWRLLPTLLNRVTKLARRSNNADEIVVIAEKE